MDREIETERERMRKRETNKERDLCKYEFDKDSYMCVSLGTREPSFPLY